MQVKCKSDLLWLAEVQDNPERIILALPLTLLTLSDMFWYHNLYYLHLYIIMRVVDVCQCQ